MGELERHDFVFFFFFFSSFFVFTNSHGGGRFTVGGTVVGRVRQGAGR